MALLDSDPARRVVRRSTPGRRPGAKSGGTNGRASSSIVILLHSNANPKCGRCQMNAEFTSDCLAKRLRKADCYRRCRKATTIHRAAPIQHQPNDVDSCQ